MLIGLHIYIFKDMNFLPECEKIVSTFRQGFCQDKILSWFFYRDNMMNSRETCCDFLRINSYIRRLLWGLGRPKVITQPPFFYLFYHFSPKFNDSLWTFVHPQNVGPVQTQQGLDRHLENQIYSLLDKSITGHLPYDRTITIVVLNIHLLKRLISLI